MAPADLHTLALQALSAAPTRLAGLLGPLPDESYRWRPGPEVWSIGQLVGHLAAAEPLFQARLRRMLEEDNPWLPSFGPEAARPELLLPLREVAIQFGGRREDLVADLSALAPFEWERPAIHEIQGPTTLALQVQNVVNHDREHLDQLAELCAAWENQFHG